MKKVLSILLIGLLTFFMLLFFKKKNSTSILKEESLLIQEQIEHVGKLVVTEGHFSEIYNYKNSKAVFGDFFTSDKKALVIVNADVTIAYDLSKLVYDVDIENKVVRIISIPKEEIKINPDIEYYDVQSGFFNPFEAKDYNEIKESIKDSLLKKLENSNLKLNAKNRLLSELSKFYIVTNSLSWELRYEEKEIKNSEDFQKIEL